MDALYCAATISLSTTVLCGLKNAANPCQLAECGKGKHDMQMKPFSSASVAVLSLLIGSLVACDPAPTVRANTASIDDVTAAVVNGEAIYISDVELEAVAQGITINALVVKTRGGGFRGPGGMPLDEHYRQHVIGGIGAFVRIADKDTSFAEAVRNKMLLEVAQGIPQTAAGPMVENRTIID